MSFKDFRYQIFINSCGFLLAILFSTSCLNSQTLLFNETPVSDVGIANNIGKANTSRNIAIDGLGNIFVVFSGSTGIRVAKSEDRGASFLPSIQVSTISNNVEPEIIINNQGIIFIAWVEGDTIKLSKSIDQGLNYTSSTTIGLIALSQVTDESIETVHLATFGNNIYISDRSGENIYSNANNGDGVFNNVNLPNFCLFICFYQSKWCCLCSARQSSFRTI